jgi:hypothetical protein
MLIATYFSITICPKHKNNKLVSCKKINIRTINQSGAKTNTKNKPNHGSMKI